MVAVMKYLLTIFVFVAVTGGTALAQAPGETEVTVPTPSVPTVSEWYGWQILVADGATFSLAGATGQGDIAFGWIGTGAAVHVAHGHNGRAVASLGLRVALPVLGLYLGAASAQGCTGEDLCGLGPALIGGMIGMGIAEVTDLAMSTDEHEVAPLGSSRSWTPVASIRHQSATLGIAARF
jgi:hypothetical protein